MPLSWNEIENRAVAFTKEWAGETSESGEAKSFWDDFFQVFGVPRRRIASFERYVSKAGHRSGYIDLFWPGTMIAEHKSRGHDLNRAFTQALDYFPGLSNKELPRYIVVSDFEYFKVYDLETDQETSFPLEKLNENIQIFSFIAGYESHTFKEQDPVNTEAAEKLAALHDELLEAGYSGHKLEVYLVRLLFCMFAEDTGIFLPRGAFQDLIEQRTSEDGSDLASHLAELFEVLNTPPTQRMRTLDKQLADFSYINGNLFEERLPMAAFDSKMRTMLIECCELHWGKVSPAIFGSLFQGIMDKNIRRSLGAHYTSEKNILKVVNPLILNELQEEFQKLKQDRGTQKKSKLKSFHKKLSELTFFDPACGCGNFLVITYREIRKLELEVIRELYLKNAQQLSLDAVEDYVKVDVDQFYGIEIEEWPAQIAQVAMWLMDHQMNIEVSKEFGQIYARVPLVKSANISHCNALTTDWNTIIKPHECSYIMGNPPFVGKRFRTDQQKRDMSQAMGFIKNHTLLDYVTAWYIKSSEFLIANPQLEVAFVSTNSITQGEQVEPLWSYLYNKQVEINFAHRTFNWASEGRNSAAVHCVIIGFSTTKRSQKQIYTYPTINSDPLVEKASQINPYLYDAPEVIAKSRRKHIQNDVPKISFGSMPIDKGNLILNDKQKYKLIGSDPLSAKYIRPYLGSEEYINGINRWCLWLANANPSDLRKMPTVKTLIENVRQYRAKSSRPATQKLAQTPSVFGEIRQPDNPYIAIPKTSSQRRNHIPIGILDSFTIANTELFTISTASAYVFGILASHMHHVWLSITGGRLKSDYRYSSNIVYNNFPWPALSKNTAKRIEATANNILAVRNRYPDATLADLYDPLTMPADLIDAHRKNDSAVESAYTRKKLKTEAERANLLFSLYQSL